MPRPKRMLASRAAPATLDSVLADARDYLDIIDGSLSRDESSPHFPVPTPLARTVASGNNRLNRLFAHPEDIPGIVRTKLGVYVTKEDIEPAVREACNALEAYAIEKRASARSAMEVRVTLGGLPGDDFFHKIRYYDDARIASLKAHLQNFYRERGCKSALNMIGAIGKSRA